MSKSFVTKAATFLAIAFAIVLAIQGISQSNKDHFVIIMERGLCHGECPAYQLTIYSDGTVYYRGDIHVAKEGDFVAKLSSSQIAILLKEIEQSKIFNDNYGCCRGSIKDVAYVRLSIILNGQETFAGYATNDYKAAPYELRHLECMIDKVANSIKWVGKDAYCKDVLK